MNAAIITDPENREKTRYPLWTLADKNGDVGKVDWDRKVIALSFAYLSEITVKLNLAYCPTMTAVLTPPFQDARDFIDSPLIEWTTSLLEVQFGYSGGPSVVVSPKFEGLLLKPEVNLSGVEASITLNAQGIGGFEAQRSATGKPEKNKSLEEVFKAIAAKNKLEVDSSELSGAELKAFTTKRDAVVVGHVSDWFFLVREAAQIGCWTYLTMESRGGKGVLKVIAADTTRGKSPDFTFRLFDFPGGIISPKDNTYPILNLSSPTSAVYLSGATQKIRAMGTDSKTRQPVQKSATDQSVAPKRTDAKQTGPQADAEGTLMPVDAGSKNTQALIDAEYKNATNNMGVRIEVETLGCPNLIPGTVVQISGVSERLDGKYAVFEVTHTLGTGGYSTSFTAVSNVAQLSDRLNNMRTAVNPNTTSKNDATPSAVDRTATLPVLSKKQVSDIAENVGAIAERMALFGF